MLPGLLTAGLGAGPGAGQLKTICKFFPALGAKVICPLPFINCTGSSTNEISHAAATVFNIREFAYFMCFDSSVINSNFKNEQKLRPAASLPAI